MPALAQQKHTDGWSEFQFFALSSTIFFMLNHTRYSLDRFVEKIRQSGKWEEVSLTQPVKELQKCCTKPLPSLCFARLRRPRYSPLAALLLLSRSHAFCFCFFVLLSSQGILCVRETASNPSFSFLKIRLKQVLQVWDQGNLTNEIYTFCLFACLHDRKNHVLQ